MTGSNPGFRNQERYRTVFRVVGVLALLAFAAFVYLGVVGIVVEDREFGARFGACGFQGPVELGCESPDSGGLPFESVASPFWFFAAVPLFAVAGFCLQAGFLGAAARYSAGETMPVVRDSASYLTDGQGVLGVGRTVDDKFCPRCGQRSGDSARFCQSCGAAFA